MTVLLLCMVFGGAALLAFFSIFTVMATDSCGLGAADEPAVCDTDYMGGILLGYWAALFAVSVLPLIASVVQMARHRRAWPYPTVGLLGLAGVTVVYFMLLVR